MGGWVDGCVCVFVDRCAGGWIGPDKRADGRAGVDRSAGVRVGGRVGGRMGGRSGGWVGDKITTELPKTIKDTMPYTLCSQPLLCRVNHFCQQARQYTRAKPDTQSASNNSNPASKPKTQEMADTAKQTRQHDERRQDARSTGRRKCAPSGRRPSSGDGSTRAPSPGTGRKRTGSCWFPTSTTTSHPCHSYTHEQG